MYGNWQHLGDKSEEAAPCISNFTSTFVLCSTSQSNQPYQVLCEVPRTLDLSRQRRAHQKSRTGCQNCKRRRVKCDEADPCENCSRRGDYCLRLRRDRRRTLSSTPVTLPTQTNLTSPTSTTADVNLFDLRLYHHFLTSTCQTLLFDSDVWRCVSQLCFEFDFLMSAILSVSARHLAFLRPDDSTYPGAATGHLCRALSKFRLALFKDLVSVHPDAFIATSVLLQFEVWAETDSFVLQDGSTWPSFHPSKDHIFSFCSSLKEMFLSSFPHAAVKKSALMPHIQHNSVNTLATQVVLNERKLAEYRRLFSYHRPISSKLLDITSPSLDFAAIGTVDPQPDPILGRHEVPDAACHGYSHIVGQVSLILSLLPRDYSEGFDPADPKSMQILARHILSFPILCRGTFASMITQGDPHALILLYHFYRAVGRLLHSTNYWWAHKRVAILEPALKHWLLENCVAATTH